MSLRRFTRVDGSSALVTAREYERRVKLQDAALARRGLEAVRNKRGVPTVATPERAAELRARSERARVKAQAQWATPEGQARKAELARSTAERNRRAAEARRRARKPLVAVRGVVGSLDAAAGLIEGLYEAWPQDGRPLTLELAIDGGRVGTHRADRESRTWRRWIVDEIAPRLIGAELGPPAEKQEPLPEPGAPSAPQKPDTPRRKESDPLLRPTRIVGGLPQIPPGSVAPLLRVEVQSDERQAT